MNRWIRLTRRSLLNALLLVFWMAMVPVSVVHADAGPKPSMDFTLQFEGDAQEVVSVTLLECEDAACADSAPLEELGPQGIHCDGTNCSALAYGFSPYHKLILEFDDRTLESNIFEKKAFDAAYQVVVKEDSLQVTENSGIFQMLCCPALGLTLVSETLVAALLFAALQLPRFFLGLVPMASLITLPVVWMVFPNLPLPGGLSTGLAEGFAALFEAGFLYFASGKTLSVRQVLLISLLMNGASYALGLLI